MNDYKNYTDWQKYILETFPSLPEAEIHTSNKSGKVYSLGGYNRVTLIAYCLTQASHGHNGLGCFASDATIAKELGIANRSVIAKYRKLAISLGWFVPNGQKRNRVEALDISVPSEPSRTQDLGLLVIERERAERVTVPAVPKYDPDDDPWANEPPIQVVQ